MTVTDAPRVPASGVALGVAHDLYRGGAVLDKLAAANRRTTFFAQIETRAGVVNADAADELRERVETRLGGLRASYDELTITTFHEFSARLLRDEALPVPIAGLDCLPREEPAGDGPLHP